MKFSPSKEEEAWWLLEREGDSMEATFIWDSFMEWVLKIVKHFFKSQEQLGTPWAVTINQRRGRIYSRVGLPW